MDDEIGQDEHRGNEFFVRCEFEIRSQLDCIGF